MTNIPLTSPTPETAAPDNIVVEIIEILEPTPNGIDMSGMPGQGGIEQIEIIEVFAEPVADPTDLNGVHTDGLDGTTGPGLDPGADPTATAPEGTTPDGVTAADPTGTDTGGVSALGTDPSADGTAHIDGTAADTGGVV